MADQKRAAVIYWSENEFDHALDYALAWEREDYVSILYLCRRAGLCPSECFLLSTETVARAVRERQLTYIGANDAPHTVALDDLLTARLERDLTGAVAGCALYLKPGQKAEEAERELQMFLRNCSITWKEGDQDE
mgnify:CR=1 FL=1